VKYGLKAILASCSIGFSVCSGWHIDPTGFPCKITAIINVRLGVITYFDCDSLVHFRPRGPFEITTTPTTTTTTTTNNNNNNNNNSLCIK